MRNFLQDAVADALAWLPALVFIGVAFTIAGIGWQAGTSLSVGKQSLRTESPRPLFGNAGEKATQNLEDAVNVAAQALKDSRITNIEIKITYKGD